MRVGLQKQCVHEDGGERRERRRSGERVSRTTQEEAENGDRPLAASATLVGAPVIGLLAGLVPGLPVEVRDRILARAEGIPLYAVETVRMLLDRGLLVQDGPAYRLTGAVEALEVPETLHALIAARLDGLSPDELRMVEGLLDPHALTIGFARRAATYKRPDLLLRDPDRLGPLLKGRRVQLVFSGKAHPADQAGKSIIALLVETIRQWPESIVFLEDYDMALGRLMTRGCDVWLNTPRRPMEASGTSGMKAAMNGTLNLSILDGWWPEGCEHGVTGWAIGDEHVGPDQDTRDLEALYTSLEQDVLQAWADPRRWTQMMRASIAMAAERFSSDRMVSEYFTRLYTAP